MFSLRSTDTAHHSVHQILNHPNDLGSWRTPFALVELRAARNGPGAARKLANDFLAWFDGLHLVDERISTSVHAKMDALVRGVKLNELIGTKIFFFSAHLFCHFWPSAHLSFFFFCRHAWRSSHLGPCIPSAPNRLARTFTSLLSSILYSADSSHV